MSGFLLFLNFSLCSYFLQKMLDRYYSLPAPPPPPPQANPNIKKENITTKLDRDALGEIMRRLCAVDQARFLTVCKDFRAAHPAVNTHKPIPWFLSIGFSLPMSQTITVEFYDPSSTSTPTSVHRISLAKSGIPMSTQTYIKTIQITNTWLLMLITQQDGIIPHKYFVLVYSPLTKQLIQLPSFYSHVHWWFVASSSTNPTSPHCIFLIAETFDFRNKLIFRTIGKGDKKWTVREFNRYPPHFIPCLPKIFYVEGIFYLFSPYGQLISYNILNGEFKYENTSICADFHNCVQPKYRNFEGFMLNGELMLMFFGNHHLDPHKFPQKPCIKSYDWSKKIWVPVTSLGDQTLFVRQNCRGVAIIRKDPRVFSNKIYHFFKAGYIIYSFEDTNLVQFKDYSETTEGIITNFVSDSGDLLEFKYGSGIRCWDKSKTIFWLDPPVIHHRVE